MPNKTMLATLALGTVIAFAAPAFADKMKATLDALTTLRPRDEIFKLRGKPIRVKAPAAIAA